METNLTPSGFPEYSLRRAIVHVGLPAFTAALLLGLVLAVSCNGNGGGGVFEVCGNGVVEGAEQCDDGNVLPCDGCSDTCMIESGYICGDGILNAACGEQCDDGNTVPGDGCDENCMSEGCGNGVLDAGEECDDGNVLPCDGCSDTCTIETGYTCGDGTVNASCGEECDDGNVLSCDGCSDTCMIESGYICGDGILNAACGEQCDDGNTIKCDGCSSDCAIEVGYVCGDGVLNASCGEECDDGNTLPGDGCDASCQIEQLSIAGEYDLSIDPVLDTCGFGTTPTTSPMEVIELTQSQVTVNIPIGGAGGECNRENFTRQGNTVTRSESSSQQIGACTVQVDVTTSLTFFGDDTVTGFETNELTALGGDCSGLALPCAVELTVSGSRCSGCFDCVMPSFAAARAGLGSLAAGTGATLDAMRRSIGAD
jgi:cysteine-rich repeat protein